MRYKKDGNRIINSTFGIRREADSAISPDSQGFQGNLHCHIEKGIECFLTKRFDGAHSIRRQRQYSHQGFDKRNIAHLITAGMEQISEAALIGG